jgi:hypothetical protein
MEAVSDAPTSTSPNDSELLETEILAAGATVPFPDKATDEDG